MMSSEARAALEPHGAAQRLSMVEPRPRLTMKKCDGS